MDTKMKKNCAKLRYIGSCCMKKRDTMRGKRRKKPVGTISTAVEIA